MYVSLGLTKYGSLDIFFDLENLTFYRQTNIDNASNCY